MKKPQPQQQQSAEEIAARAAKVMSTYQGCLGGGPRIKSYSEGEAGQVLADALALIHDLTGRLRRADKRAEITWADGAKAMQKACADISSPERYQIESAREEILMIDVQALLERTDV